jgi:hypothetical protein
LLDRHGHRRARRLGRYRAWAGGFGGRIGDAGWCGSA